MIERLLQHPGSWLFGPESEIAVCSRIRLARNVAGHSFSAWAETPERLELMDQLSPCAMRLPGLVEPQLYRMMELDELDRELLFERHFISREFYEGGEGCAVVISADESAAVMINEEDHLRLQVMHPGLCLDTLWDRADRLDDALSEMVDYSFSEELGFLTSCPSNLGTGLRASVLLHLPGLALLEEVDRVMAALKRIGMAVRGLWGEGSDAVGQFYQISNQVTLGASEESIISELNDVVREVVQHERNARARLMESPSGQIDDFIGRSYGLLRYAHVLETVESINHLSSLRMGLDMGLLKSLPKGKLDELMIAVQPAHLQRRIGNNLNNEQRDRARAQMVKKLLRTFTIKNDGAE